jgi:hypothetical protein
MLIKGRKVWQGKNIAFNVSGIAEGGELVALPLKKDMCYLLSNSEMQPRFWQYHVSGCTGNYGRCN